MLDPSMSRSGAFASPEVQFLRGHSIVSGFLHSSSTHSAVKVRKGWMLAGVPEEIQTGLNGPPPWWDTKTYRMGVVTCEVRVEERWNNSWRGDSTGVKFKTEPQLSGRSAGQRLGQEKTITANKTLQFTFCSQASRNQRKRPSILKEPQRNFHSCKS